MERELSMTSERTERLELVTKRLENELTCQNDFFQKCCKLALGLESSIQPHEYLSYRVCRERLGHKKGVYLCLLYAQLFAADCLLKQHGDQLDKSLHDEFLCINRELLSQILLMVTQHDEPDHVRDALYWFYNDYCELLVQLHKSLAALTLSGVDDRDTVMHNDALVFGGPFLISTSCCCSDVHWKQHTWDCGLYLGKRFEERLSQAIRRIDSRDCLLMYTQLFPQNAPTAAYENEGFLLTSWQRKQWEQMSAQLRLMAKQ